MSDRKVTIRAMRIALLTEANTTWMVPHGARLLVGRGPDGVDIVVKDPMLPRRCFGLDFMRGPWCQIRELASPAPILVNNRRLGNGQILDLRDGDQIIVTAKSRFGVSYTKFTF